MSDIFEVGNTVKVVSDLRTECGMIGKVVKINPEDKVIDGELATFFPIVVEIDGFKLPNAKKPNDKGYDGNPCFKPSHLELMLYSQESLVNIIKGNLVKCPKLERFGKPTLVSVKECVECERLNMVVSQDKISCFEQEKVIESR